MGGTPEMWEIFGIDAGRLVLSAIASGPAPFSLF